MSVQGATKKTIASSYFWFIYLMHLLLASDTRIRTFQKYCVQEVMLYHRLTRIKMSLVLTIGSHVGYGRMQRLESEDTPHDISSG